MIENKNIFIVGGSSGIGLSLIKQISSKNNIYSASRNDNNLNEYNVKHRSEERRVGKECER